MLNDHDYCWDEYDSDVDREYIPDEEIECDSETEVQPTKKVSSESLDNIVQVVEVVEQELQEGRENSVKKLTRKRERDEANWKCNIRKRKHERGEEYVSVRKQIVPAKRVNVLKDCQNKCIYKCAVNITELERQTVFSEYYALNYREKQLFILSTTERFKAEARRKGKCDGNSRKGQSFRYYFNIKSQRVQVCKIFYLGTLSISQKPVYTARNNKTALNTPQQSLQGKHRKKFTSDENIALIKEHIESFPKVESHYCRANTKKEYLESSLSIKKMYELYIERVEAQGQVAVKYCIYQKVFCSNYNLYFHRPRKDKCDLCEEIKLKRQEKGDITTEQLQQYETHILEKNIMRENRKKDTQENKVVLCFDLENVLSCPKAEVKNFFYKSKLNVYNMTAHLSLGNKVYCAIWPETMTARGGNDIASAVHKILKRVLKDHPMISEITLWSDSCVPQNRNSFMSFAMAHILQTHNNLNKLTMKFCVPGHSALQVVDAVHSSIEKVLRPAEYYSPLSLMRILLKMRARNPLIVIQMKPEDFKDFQASASKLNYRVIPFSKVTSIQLTRVLHEANYKTAFSQDEFTTINLRHCSTRRGLPAAANEDINLKIYKSKSSLPQSKINAIRSMFAWIPKVDQDYFKVIIPSLNEELKKEKRGKKKIFTKNASKLAPSLEPGSSTNTP